MLVDKNIAKNFKELRKSYNMTAEDVSKALNIPMSTIANIETSRNRPSEKTLEKYMKYFKATRSFLLNGEETELDKIVRLSEEYIYHLVLPQFEDLDDADKLISMLEDVRDTTAEFLEEVEDAREEFEEELKQESECYR